MNPSWQIEYQCPQCGAPVTLEESDRLFTCIYCRVRLYIVAKPPVSYYLPPKPKATGEVFYVPYWRFRGVSFWGVPYEVRHRLIDSSLLAFSHRSFPPTMGIRPQTLKLRFLTSETDGRFLKPRFSVEEGIVRVEKLADAFNSSEMRSLFFRVFLGERSSLIYAPFFIAGEILYDAVLGRKLRRLSGPLEGEDAGEWPLSDVEKSGGFSFVPTICPDCGNDLAAERESVILLCRNCSTSWKPLKEGLVKSEFAVITLPEDQMIHLPFWKIKVQVEELGLRSYADLARAANLPVIWKREWEEIGCHLWFPAFKVNPSTFLRISKQMTLTLPSEEMKNRLPPGPVHPVTLPAEEAAESIRVTLADLVVGKKEVFPRLAAIQPDLMETLLVYVPFLVQGNELIHPRMGFSIQRATLTLGAQL